jgi:hypothetical protein
MLERATHLRQVDVLARAELREAGQQLPGRVDHLVLMGRHELCRADRLGFGAFLCQTPLVQGDVDQEAHRGDHREQDQEEDPHPQGGRGEFQHQRSASRLWNVEAAMRRRPARVLSNHLLSDEGGLN